MKILSTFLFIFMLLSFISCHKNEESQGCVSCLIEQGKTGKVNLALLPNKVRVAPMKYWYADERRGGLPKYFLADIESKDEYLNLCLEYLQKNKIPFEREKVFSVVLYLNQNLSTSTTVEDTNIKGMSVYTEIENNFKHQLFIKKKASFHEKYEKHFYTSNAGISHNHLAITLNEEIISEETPKSYMIITGKYENNNISTSTNPSLMISVLKPSGTSRDYDSSTMGCISPCEYRSGVCLRNKQTGQIACRAEEDYICQGITFYSTLKDNNYNNEASYFDISLMYDFRDNF